MRQRLSIPGAPPCLVPSSLGLAHISPSSRTLATTPSRQGFTDKLIEGARGKLFKGSYPGPKDPYADRQPDDRIEQIRREREAAEADPEYAEYLNDQIQLLEAKPRRRRPDSRLTLTPRKSSAPRPAEIRDPGYVMATTSEGLEEVGGLEDWWDQPGHWGPESRFNGFGPVNKVTDRDCLEVFTRQAVVEALALRVHGLEESLTTLKPRNDRPALDRTLGIAIEVTEDGQVTLKGDAAVVVEGLQWEQPTDNAAVDGLEAPAEQEAAPDETTNANGVTATTTPEVLNLEESALEVLVPEETAESPIIAAEEALELVKSWDRKWRAISLEDARLKFAVSAQFSFPKRITARAINSIQGHQAHLSTYRPPHPRRQARQGQQRLCPPQHPRQATQAQVRGGRGPAETRTPRTPERHGV
jgi:hypothetical protein